MAPNPKDHWQTVYQTKAPTDVSWYQSFPQRSLSFIQSTGLPPQAAVVDVGSGASTLVDGLLAVGFNDITVLDVAPAALEMTKARLGTAAAHIQFIDADITQWEAPRRYDLWHDRAVFHFLVDPALRDRYLNVLRAAIAPGGCAVMATFGPQGPTRCSGLDVQRYSAADLSALLGSTFHLVNSEVDEHVTPSKHIQQFMYGVWRAEA